MPDNSPADHGFAMPAEWAPHDRCWMAWPCRAALWGEGLQPARQAYAAVARAIAAFEPVSMLANDEELAEAKTLCGAEVDCRAIALDDSWMRDIGPSFVTDGKGNLAGVDWRFNAWGERFHPYDRDAALAAALLDRLGVQRFSAPLILEGGSIHVDGEGSLITSEECLLAPNRNPDMGREEIEDLLMRFTGVSRVIWLGRGLEDDDTDGHIDNLACFVRPGVVMAVVCDDPEDPNHPVLQDNLQRLRMAQDARGRALEVIELPLPQERRYLDSQRLALSYVNFYIANGGVVMPSFGDPNDKAALDIIAKAFPERRVVQVPASDILVGGGGIHCITQQQPRP